MEINLIYKKYIEDVDFEIIYLNFYDIYSTNFNLYEE